MGRSQQVKPQVLLIITARFGRLFWKYRAMAYAAILKHVSVMYQTLYLVATSMNLAPSALGAGLLTNYRLRLLNRSQNPPVQVDLDTSKLIGLIQERKALAIEALLKSWGTEILEQIEEVSMDLYKMYKSVFNRLCPEAVITADRFHVTKLSRSPPTTPQKN